MATPVVRTRIAVLASCDVLSSGSQPSANAMPPGEVDLVLDGDVVSLAVGYGHALVAVSEGQVFSWGRNDSFGKLGIGEDSPIVLQHKPRQVLGDIVGRKIVQVAAGSHHCLALDEDGAIYGWGMDIYGQTGLRCHNFSVNPRKHTGETGRALGKMSCPEASLEDERRARLSLEDTEHLIGPCCIPLKALLVWTLETCPED